MQQPVREYFPLTDTFITLDNYEERAVYAFEKTGLPSYWEAYDGYHDFTERFGFVPNAVQQEIMDIVSDVSSAGIYILEAPMGLGKTEAWRIRRLLRLLPACAGENPTNAIQKVRELFADKTAAVRKKSNNIIGFSGLLSQK